MLSGARTNLAVTASKRIDRQATAQLKFALKRSIADISPSNVHPPPANTSCPGQGRLLLSCEIDVHRLCLFSIFQNEGVQFCTFSKIQINIFSIFFLHHKEIVFFFHNPRDNTRAHVFSWKNCHRKKFDIICVTNIL